MYLVGTQVGQKGRLAIEVVTDVDVVV